MEDHHPLAEWLAAVTNVLARVLHGLTTVTEYPLPRFPHGGLAGVATAGEVRHVQRLASCLYDAFQGVLLYPDLRANGLPTPQIVQVGVTSTLHDIHGLFP